MNRWLPLLISLVSALLLITAGGWSFDLKPLWAFSFLIYLPFLLRLSLGGLILLSGLFVPTLTALNGSAILCREGEMRSSMGRPRAPSRNTRVIVFSLLAGLLFWLWREQTYHGDALLKLQLLATRTLRTDPYIWKEPLDSLSAYTFTAFVQRWQWSPTTAIALLSVLAGIVYVAAVIAIVRFLATTRRQQFSYGIALLALGSSQLWFGHLENYSLVTAAAFGMMALAVGYTKGQVGLGWVGLAAGLALSFHPQALFAMPALLLLLERRRWQRHLLVLGSSALVAPTMTVILLWLAGAPLPLFNQGYAGDPQLFWTLRQAVAPQQLLDALNNLWLVAPLFPLWLVVGIMGLSRQTVRRDRLFRYLGGVTVGLLVYHFAFQNDLPRWRDWDLFAIVGPGLTLWGIYSWWALAATARAPHMAAIVGQPAWTTALPPALTFAAAFTIAWVGVNHSLTLIHPNADQRDIYSRYRLLDLRERLSTATITPATPICAAATGCERVSATTFVMPQDGDERPTIFAHAPAQIAWSLALPPAPTFLWLSPALDPVAWGWGGDGVTFAVVVRHNGSDDLLWSRHLTPAEPHDLDWQETFVDLTPYAGQSVTLVLVTAPGMADNADGDRAGWGMPWLMQGTVDRRFGA